VLGQPPAFVVDPLFLFGGLPDLPFQIRVAYEDEHPWLAVGARWGGGRGADRLFDEMARHGLIGEEANTAATVHLLIEGVGPVVLLDGTQPFESVGDHRCRHVRNRTNRTFASTGSIRKPYAKRTLVYCLVLHGQEDIHPKGFLRAEAGVNTGESEKSAEDDDGLEAGGPPEFGAPGSGSSD
jgi:hypothetical protein